MPRSLILDVVGRAAFHTVLAFSLYLLFAGHNAPGGGFVGGLVAAAALVLQYARGGSARVHESVRVRPEVVLGIGMLLAGLTGASGWLVGGEFLEGDHAERVLPLLGAVKVTTALPFDTGVYLVVVGLVLSTLRTLGGEEAPRPAAGPDVEFPNAGASGAIAEDDRT